MSVLYDDSLSISYGVNWSGSVRPNSHCWFSCASDKLSSSRECGYDSCTLSKTKGNEPTVECGACNLLVHAIHLKKLTQTTDANLPSCRLSFTDHTVSNYDQHFWSHIRLLSRPCEYCKSKSLHADTSAESTAINANGKTCLWCLRSYHSLCWEILSNENNCIECDYGMFQNIVVRPQWLYRSSELLFEIDPKYNEISSTPTIFFINKHSGGQVGERMYRKLLQHLNPRQIFLLENDKSVIDALSIYSTLPNIRICTCGGDGTISWVLSCLSQMYPSQKNPPMSIYPLGTCNDLSRILGWGGYYNQKNFFSTIIRTHQAVAIPLDYWQVHVKPLEERASEMQPQTHRIFPYLFRDPKFIRDTNRISYVNHQKLPNTRFFNYMSFGLDSAIALEFHHSRTRDPSSFSSVWMNKLRYACQGLKYLDDFARSPMWNIGSHIRLTCDDENLTHAVQDCHALLLLNIPAYVCGKNPWREFQLNRCTTTDTDQFTKQDMGDHKIEVIGLNTRQMMTIHIGCQGHRIAQSNRICIEINSAMTAHMDGEPFYFPSPVTIDIKLGGQVLVLRKDDVEFA